MALAESSHDHNLTEALPPSARALEFQLHNLMPHLSALDNVEIAMLGTRRSRHQQRDRALELLTAVDLDGLAARRFNWSSTFSANSGTAST